MLKPHIPENNGNNHFPCSIDWLSLSLQTTYNEGNFKKPLMIKRQYTRQTLGNISNKQITTRGENIV